MPDGFDVFLSHNSRDKPIVEEIGARLRGEGLRVWLDKWELRPGFPWQEGIEEGVQASRAVAVFVGKDGLGSWQEPEMRAFIARSRREKVPVIPVLLPGCPDSPRLTLFLEAFTWVDLRAGLTEDGLARLLWGITGTKPPEGPASETRPPMTWWRWGVGLSLLVVLAVAAWPWLRPPEPGPLPTPPKPESTAVSGDERRQEPELPAPDPHPQVKIHPKEPETWFRGQVVDQSGHGVPGARVFRHGSPSEVAIAGEEGYFELKLAVPSGERARLRAELERAIGENFCLAGSDTCALTLLEER